MRTPCRFGHFCTLLHLNAIIGCGQHTTILGIIEVFCDIQGHGRKCLAAMHCKPVEFNQLFPAGNGLHATRKAGGAKYAVCYILGVHKGNRLEISQRSNSSNFLLQCSRKSRKSQKIKIQHLALMFSAETIKYNLN